MAASTAEIAFRELHGVEDIQAIGRIVESSGLFSSEEIRIAQELASDRLQKGEGSDYRFVIVEEPSAGESPGRSRTQGYSCYGPVAGTLSSFDLYWIAVDKELQGKGLGRILLAATEKLIWEEGGSRIYVETSSTAPYAPTRAFYEKNGYVKETVLEDFYRPGDSKVIYLKVRAAGGGKE